MKQNTVVLCILDGWGNGIENKYNAISSSNIPCWRSILDQYPNSQLTTSGCDVGLPEGQIGNSEVGHSNIGSGRILLQDLYRINKEIKDVEQNIDFLDFINKIKKKGGVCHIAGLLSDGGVHSHQKHIFHLIDVISKLGLKVSLHCFLDGRDSLPSSAIGYIKELEHIITNNPNVKLSTVSGRYYAMDRDNRLDRTEKSYYAMAFAQGDRYKDALALINHNYELGVTDEFIKPSIIADYQGMSTNDGFLIINFRSDRVLQLLKMVTGQIKGYKNIHLNTVLGMVKYSKFLNIPSIFSNNDIDNTLGEVIANQGLKQLRIAETEKYAHVTFFFNGGREKPFLNEDRIIIQSPDVSTYDLMPEMSAYKLTDELICHINKQIYSLIVINYANPDMVGHTGNLQATKKAIKTVDQCLEKLIMTIKSLGCVLIITADHGNAEKMFDIDNNVPYTAHTINTVPFVICNCNRNFTLRNGRLCDIAPTLLQILNIKKPKEMTGKSLICL